MLIRLASVLLVTLIVAGAGVVYGLTGLLFALPVAVLFSILTEKLISRVQSDQSIETLRRR
jgi:predicted PurR-regulated permease PerM